MNELIIFAVCVLIVNDIIKMSFIGMLLFFMFCIRKASEAIKGSN